MKLQLEELNNHMWYRAMKVIYAIIYATLISIGVYLATNTAYYETPAQLPNSAKEAFQDDNFYTLTSSEMISVLREIDSDFAGLPSLEQQKVIDKLNQIKAKNAKGKANFIYFPRVEFNLINFFQVSLLYILVTFASMESIRRIFYYVLTGKAFPQQGSK